MKYIVSYGAGLNSTTLLVYLYENKKPIDLVIFADTREEEKWTYDSLKYYKKWCKQRDIEFVTVESKYNISIYDYYYQKQITPSRMKRDCTTKFKISPIRNYIRTRYGKQENFTFYIGIDYDESHRMRESDVQYITNNYPLVDAKINREQCIGYLSDRGLPVPKKSGCWFCPFNKKGRWIEMAQKEPQKFDKAIALETNNKRYPELVSLLNAKPLINIKHSFDNQKTLEDFDHTCDISGSCFL